MILVQVLTLMGVGPVQESGLKLTSAFVADQSFAAQVLLWGKGQHQQC